MERKELTNWFVIHNLGAYGKRPNLIGFVPKVGEWAYEKVKQGDMVVYYCVTKKPEDESNLDSHLKSAIGKPVIVGIFEVIDKAYEEYKGWRNSPYQFLINHIDPIFEEPFDFRYLVKTDGDKLEIFRKQKWFKDLESVKRYWGVALKDRALVELTREDFALIKDTLKTWKENPEYFKGFEIQKVDLKGKKVHQKVVDKWVEKQKAMFGPIKPEVQVNVGVNRILPESVRLTENRKEVDGYSVLRMGKLDVYKGVLEVHHRGSLEDTVVRAQVVLPFVNQIDIVTNTRDYLKIKELLSRIADPNLLKARLRLHRFGEYIKD
ncbi:MAG: EVE domain-containing protein [Candidatus Bathyarchaeum sp.]|nr:MAG: EVE domain-containing protein [Candidatus Bathyarchaeum sp.]